MTFKLKFCAAALMLSACGDVTLPDAGNSGIVETPYILEAQRAAAKKFGDELTFVTMYENKEAVCGDVKKGEGDLQQFIYARNNFLLQEGSAAGDWESQWLSECDDG